MKSSFDLTCLNWKTNQRLVNFPFCDSEFSLPYLSFCLFVFCFFKHFFLSLIEFLDFFFFFFISLHFLLLLLSIFVIFTLFHSLVLLFWNFVFYFISVFFPFLSWILNFSWIFFYSFCSFTLFPFAVACFFPVSFLLFTFLVFCLYFSSFLLLDVCLCVLVAVALRNQKIKMSSGVGQITKVANSVSIPALSQLTICFEVERTHLKQVWINVTDYFRSFWFD